MQKLLITLSLLAVFSCNNPQILERPTKFPMNCEITSTGCVYTPSAIWDQTSDAKSCLSHQEFITITGHIVSLNNTIDRYEAMIRDK